MNEVWHAAVALSRVGARVVESGPGGQELAAGRGRSWRRYLTRVPRGGGLPAGLSGRDRAVRVLLGRERPVHRGRAVDQAG